MEGMGIRREDIMSNNIITITVNGIEIKGTAADVMQIIGAMSGTAVAGTTAKKEVRTDYTNKNAGFDNFKVNVDKAFVKFTHKDGSYLNEGFIRKALNERAKAAGAVWDKESKAWKFASAKKAGDFEKSCTTEGLDAEVDAIIAKTNERNAKKNEKNA